MGGRVVVVSDGKRGHENQSRVIARMLGDPEPLLMSLRDNIKNGGLSELLLRLRLRFKGGPTMSQVQAMQLVARYLVPDDNQSLRNLARRQDGLPGSLLFVVSSGTPPATFNLIMSRMLVCRSIVNMSPSLLPHSLFNAVVLPEHDLHGRQPAINEAVSTLALGYHDQPAARFLASQLRRDAGLQDGEYWGVALGGPSKACRWEGDVILDELAQLRGLARGEGVKLLVTTSRRTPEWCLAWLEKHYIGIPEVAYFLDASKDPLNPLPAFYELSSRMFVTGDSFSMVSEAIHAGHRPVVLKVQPALAPNKLGRALKALSGKALVTLAQAPAEELAKRTARSPSDRLVANEHYAELEQLLREKLGFYE